MSWFIPRHCELVFPWIVLKYTFSWTLALMFLEPTRNLQGSEENNYHKGQGDNADNIIKV
jgi:hypothetical protein